MLLFLFAPKLQITAYNNCKIQWAVALLNIPRLTKAEVKQRGSSLLISTDIVFWLSLWYTMLSKTHSRGHRTSVCTLSWKVTFWLWLHYSVSAKATGSPGNWASIHACFFPHDPNRPSKKRSTPEVIAICILLSYTLTVNVTSEQGRDLLQRELFRAREEWTQMQSSANMGMTEAAVTSGPLPASYTRTVHLLPKCVVHTHIYKQNILRQAHGTKENCLAFFYFQKHKQMCFAEWW